MRMIFLLGFKRQNHSSYPLWRDSQRQTVANMNGMLGDVGPSKTLPYLHSRLSLGRHRERREQAAYPKRYCFTECRSPTTLVTLLNLLFSPTRQRDSRNGPCTVCIAEDVNCRSSTMACYSRSPHALAYMDRNYLKFSN